MTTMRNSGPSSPSGGMRGMRDLRNMRAPGGDPRGTTRRGFLRNAAACACAGVVAQGATLTGMFSRTPTARAAGKRFFVMLRLYGGNDGLNTVIPVTQGIYHDRRPTLRVAPEDALMLNATLGFHPSMTELHQHYLAGRLAVVNSVGYDPANLSHFRSEVIWQSADPDTVNGTGWIGRYLDTLAPAGDPVVRGVDMNWSLDHVFQSDHANVFALPSPESAYFPTDYFGNWEDNARKRALFERISQEPRTSGSPAETIANAGYALSRNVDLYAAESIGDLTAETVVFPDTYLGSTMRDCARNIAAACRGDIQTAIYQVGIGGFDTHGEQDAEGGHPDLWRNISQSLNAFHAEMTRQGIADDVIVLVWSEFGRRVEENGSNGTDHGTAAPVFVFGNPVIGGLYGAEPNLSTLDQDDNLLMDVDFRQTYATVLERWLSADSRDILGGTFAPVPFLPT